MPRDKGGAFELGYDDGVPVKFTLASRKQLAPLGVPQYRITPTPAELAQPEQLLEIPLDDYRDGSGHSFAVVPTGYEMARGVAAVNGNELRSWGRGRERTFSIAESISNARFFTSNTKLWVIGGNTALRFLVEDVTAGTQNAAMIVPEHTHNFPENGLVASEGVRFGDKVYVPLVDAAGAAQRFAVLDLTTNAWSRGPAGITAHVLYSDGQALWRASGNKVASCLADPTAADDWGTEYTVGDSSYHISAIGQWEREHVFGRPDGFWTFDEKFIARRDNLGAEYALTADAFEGMRTFWGYLYAPSSLGLLRWRPGVVEYVGPEAQRTLDSLLAAGLGEVRAILNYGPWLFAYGTSGNHGAILTLLTGTAGQDSVAEQLDREQDRRAQHLDIIPAVGRLVSASDQPVRDASRDFTPDGDEPVRNAQSVPDRDVLFLLRGNTAEAWDVSSDRHLTRAQSRDLNLGAGRTVMFAHGSNLWAGYRQGANAVVVHYTVPAAGAPVQGGRAFNLPSLRRTTPGGTRYETRTRRLTATIVGTGTRSGNGNLNALAAARAQAEADARADFNFRAGQHPYNNDPRIIGPSITVTSEIGPTDQNTLTADYSYTIRAVGHVSYVQEYRVNIQVPGSIEDYDYVAAAVHDNTVWLFDTRKTGATCYDLSGNAAPARDQSREFDPGVQVAAAAVVGDTLYLTSGQNVIAYDIPSSGPPTRSLSALVLSATPTGATAFGSTLWFMERTGIAYAVRLPDERRVAAPFLLALSSEEPSGGSTVFTLLARELPIAALSPGEGNTNRDASDAEWLSARVTAPHITIPKAYESVEFDLDHEGGTPFDPRVELRFPGARTVELDLIGVTGQNTASRLYRVPEGLDPHAWAQVRIWWDEKRRATIRGLRLRAWQRPRLARHIVVRANLLREGRRTPLALQRYLEDLASEEHGVERFTDPRGDRYDVVVTGVSFQQLQAQESEQPEWIATIEMREANVARLDD